MILWTMMAETNIYLWRSEALVSPASSEGRTYKCVLWILFLGGILHVIWKKLKFAIVFSYYKLSLFNMS